jgi:hypothetical protein
MGCEPFAMKNMGKKVEVTANIAIIMVAIMIGVVFVQKYFPRDKSREAIATPLGEKVAIPNVEWGQKKKTVILALQEGCRYCSDSASFYQQLAKEAEKRAIQIVAVLPQPVEKSESYLESLKIPINTIRQASFPSIGIRGTPTILLVDTEGKVTDSWVGKLSLDKEKEVLERL